MLTTISVIVYIASVRPYIVSYVNRQEIVNELTVLAASYPLLIMTPWVFDIKARNTGGMCIVILIVGNILFNIGVVIVIFIR